jgi:hypothetical protein
MEDAFKGFFRCDPSGVGSGLQDSQADHLDYC